MNLWDIGIGLIIGFVLGCAFSWRRYVKKRKTMVEKSRIEPIYYDLGRLLK